ncbi:MAG: cytochrome C oxidase subunit III [Deltaproteobacteria bacterium CG11_big_fil_rev_8_21_14_0_20_47_16]|nr:MAG: cytochrome C oxidase subunit III [Deltaproteobacteria bacterium CG11_big_fil_rev_8_21_14_0_20_47_16]
MSDATSGAHVAHHFDNAEQQFSSAKLGLWLFLVTEVLLFGGLFVAYIMFRALYPDMFAEAHHHLNKVMGGINTVVLICSSLSMAMAVHFVRDNDRVKAVKLLSFTFLCGATFMVIKFFEYKEKFAHHLFPNGSFDYSAFTHKNANLFYSLYFIMTGLHGLHVLIGMGLIAWVLIRTRRNNFSSEYYTPVELTGLYWHLVDLVWIYLFPLMYLIA